MSGVPSSLRLSHIISGSVPARRWSPVAASNSAWMRFRLPRQSEVRNDAGVLALLAVAEARAPDARDLAVPGQHLEGLRLRDADELRRLGAVADVVRRAGR